MRPPKKYRRYVKRWFRDRRRSCIYSHPPGSFAGMRWGNSFLTFRLIDTITGEKSLGFTA